MDPDLDRREGDAEHLGDLGVGESVQVVQQDDGAVGIRQSLQVFLHAVAHLSLFHGLVESRRIVGDGFEARTRCFRGPVAQRLGTVHERGAAEPVQTQVRGDAVQPGGQSAGVVQGRELAMRTQQRLLGQILGRSRIANDAEDVSLDRVGVPRDAPEQIGFGAGLSGHGPSSRRGHL